MSKDLIKAINCPRSSYASHSAGVFVRFKDGLTNAIMCEDYDEKKNCCRIESERKGGKNPPCIYQNWKLFPTFSEEK